MPASPGEEARERIRTGMGLRKEDTNFKDPKESSYTWGKVKAVKHPVRVQGIDVSMSA